MKLKNNILFFFGCLCSSLAFGQLDTYDHKIELSSVEDQWHAIELPDAVFGKISQNMADLRIYGVTASDTIEAPYILKIATEKKLSKKVDFKVLNSVSNAKGYYFTYEIPTAEAINEIQLDFKNKNFDWKIVLEASQNQQEWFTLLDNYRLLAIKNTQTDYSYTNLNFKDSKYRYYRLLVQSKEKPEILQANINMDTKTPADYAAYTVTYMDIKEVAKRTVIDIDLKQRLPLSYLKINVSDQVDYYRPFTLQYVSDSINTEKGWRYNYRDLSSGILNSIEKNEFKFASMLAQKIRITIQNYDNQPLTIESAEAKGYSHKLIARFNKPANYYLTYGKANTRKPQYDIAQVVSKIPDNPTKLTLGEVENIPKKETPTVSPLFENKIWLWAVMGIVILVLGGFTLKMMQKK